MKLKRNQDRFHVIAAGIVILVLIVIVGIGLTVMDSKEDTPTSTANTQQQNAPAADSGPPLWEYSQQRQRWLVKSGTAPACKDPLVFNASPVDMSKVTAIGLPGAYRGYDYKAHGGFRIADSTNGIVEVRLPMDANFRGLTHYYESMPGYPDEIQYLVDFESDCGIAFRFDHILTLSPTLQAYADKLPPPKKDDTRGNPNAEHIRVPMKAGDVIATAVGAPRARNFGFDFGVYDYRSPNSISKNKQWAAIHAAFSASAFHGICWLPMLPGSDAAKAEAIAKDRNNYNANKPFNLTSDYCNIAPHTTLDFNSGQPTDG